MQHTLTATLELVQKSLGLFLPELIIISGILFFVTAGLFKKIKPVVFHASAVIFFALVLCMILVQWPLKSAGEFLFLNMVRADQFGDYFKLLFSFSGILTVVITWLRRDQQKRLPEYYALIFAVSLGANLLVMSTNFVMVFLSLELISIPSYVLTGLSFERKSAEGSLKYFIFGSIASAFMLYGMSLLYGLSGTIQFTSSQFADAIGNAPNTLFLVGIFMTLCGFLYKAAAAPLHPWVPDVYEAAPIPIVAFFSVVPKLAGIGILTRFVYAINLSTAGEFYWQVVLAGVAILSLSIGNFSALWQKNPKRLMAYSSIAQTGFIMVGLVVFPKLGVENLLFYATIFVLLNYLVFLYLSYFQNEGFEAIDNYAGIGKRYLVPSIFLLIGFVGLTGLPPTAGFTAKLFIFSTLWQAYSISQKTVFLVLLIFGLLNTVVSLFYYFRIPFYSFIKPSANVASTNILTWENLFGGILVLLVLILFFSPGLLMGWINKINFVF